MFNVEEIFQNENTIFFYLFLFYESLIHSKHLHFLLIWVIFCVCVLKFMDSSVHSKVHEIYVDYLHTRNHIDSIIQDSLFLIHDYLD